jgi:hypothetical protein
VTLTVLLAWTRLASGEVALARLVFLPPVPLSTRAVSL